MQKSIIQLTLETYLKSKEFNVDQILSVMEVSHRSFRYYLKSKGHALYEITVGMAEEIEEAYYASKPSIVSLSEAYKVSVNDISDIVNNGTKRYTDNEALNNMLKAGVPSSEIRASGYHCGTTEKEKEEINKLLETGLYTNAEVAKMFNLSPGRISQIKRDKAQRKKYRYLSEETKNKIREEKNKGASADNLAAKYKVSRSQVYNICRGN